MNEIDSNVSLIFLNETEVEEMIIEKKIKENVIIDPETINNVVKNNATKELVLKDIECLDNKENEEDNSKFVL